MSARDEYPLGRVDLGSLGVAYTVEPGTWHDLCDEVDKFRKHSVILNSVAWRISEALGKVGPDDTAIEGDVQADLEELIEQLESCSWPAGSSIPGDTQP